MALHTLLHCIYCIAWHLELCLKHMVATVPVQYRLSMQLHTLLGMKAGDMASHLIHCIGIFTALASGVMSPLLAATVPVQHRLLGITMQLHTLLGMKARVYVHPCAYSIVYRCGFIPCWAWRQEFMCIYMHFCMVLRAGCDEIYRDILWIIMSHIVLWLKLWIYDMWPVWVFGFWFDVVVVKLTWEEILFLVKWVMVWLKGQWRCYMHFLTFLSPSITLNII